MNKQNIAIGIAVVALLVSSFGVFFKDSTKLGAINVEDYVSVIKYEGYNSTKPITLSGSDGDLTVGGGNVNFTTSNTATSSLIVGCIQTYATSTATPVIFQPTSNIGTASTTGANGLYFVASWKYGSCPA